MKKFLISILLIAILTSCTSATAAKSTRDTATYLESVDNNDTFEVIKIVDKESGCKYLLILSDGYNGKTSSTTQMSNKDGKPLCK